MAQKASAQAGKWRTPRTPLLAEIMNALPTRSPAELVGFMKEAQSGGTE